MEFAENAGFEIVHISKHDFNYGKTRQLDVEMLKGYEFLVFLIQDALPADSDASENFLQEFEDGKVSTVNERLLPKAGSGAIETHVRLYNYPAYLYLKQMMDISKFGLKAAFLSNSFSAYRRDALLQIGGSPGDVIFGEEYLCCCKISECRI